MLKYNIQDGKNNSRVIIVSANDLQRYALHDLSEVPLTWQRIGSQAIAIAHTDIKVYRKPSVSEYHKEYMQHNGRSLWLGFYPDFSRLARNMYEFISLI